MSWFPAARVWLKTPPTVDEYPDVERRIKRVDRKIKLGFRQYPIRDIPLSRAAEWERPPALERALKGKRKCEKRQVSGLKVVREPQNAYIIPSGGRIRGGNEFLFILFQ
jgi:hypothetical protein